MPDRSAIRLQMGVVSPCSTCKNRRAVSENGFPPCPRRYWMELFKDEDADVSSFLAASGTDKEDQLVNPVRLEKDSIVLVWAAALEDNAGIFQEGVRVSPDILNPAFDTSYITCGLHPFVIQDTEASQAAGGVYKEMDQLQMATLDVRQQDMAGSRLPIAGFVKKVTFGSHYAFLIPDQDVLVPGT